MSFNSELTFDELNEAIYYDSETGKMFWKINVSKKCRAGAEAGSIRRTRNNENGEPVKYRYIRYKEKEAPATRVAWLLHYGEWPIGRIKPIDGDTLNIAISNLTETNSVSKEYGSQAEYMKAHRQENPIFWKNTHLQRRFGIDFDQYLEMVSEQGNRCAICGKKETAVRKGEPVSLSVDHCHTTGRVRALLCKLCNTGIGSFQENPECLSAAIKYLEKHSDCDNDRQNEGTS